jgi:predicted ATPase
MKYTITRKDAVGSLPDDIQDRLTKMSKADRKLAVDNLMECIWQIVQNCRHENGRYYYSAAYSEVRDLLADEWANPLAQVMFNE